MASRVHIAAAACIVASGLFVGGGSAALAFADTQSGDASESGGQQASGAPEPGAAPSPRAVAADVPSVAPTTRAPTHVAVTGAVPKPAPHIGNGRNGLASGEPDATRAGPSASKHLEADRRAPSQTSAAVPGEPDPDASARLATPPQKSAEQVPGTLPPEKAPADENPKDPNDPKDPKEHQPGFGRPWWGPCPGPDDPGGPGLPPGSGGGSGGGSGSGGGGTQPKPPNGRPSPPPAMRLPLPREVPPELPNISADPVLDAATGVATAAAEVPFVPITLPVIVAPFGAGGAGTGPRAGNPSAPRIPGVPESNQPPSRTGQQNPPAFSAGNGAPPEGFRVGYGNYLRTAGVGEMMAVAVPGVTGILALTGAGGLLGYRQARAGHTVRANGTARFMG